MKTCAVLIGFFTTFSCFSQDTLLFKDGRTVAVAIIDVQPVNEFIIYLKNGDTTLVPFSVVEKMYYQSEWKNPDDYSAGSGSLPDLEKREFVFRTQKNHTPSKFSVAVNLTSPFLRMNSSFFKRQSFNDNQTISLEAEYRISERFSVKIPGVIGLGVQGGQQEFERNYAVPDPYYSSSLYGTYWSFERSESNPAEVSVNNRTDSWWSSYVENPHERNIVYQGGLGFKFFPFGFSKNEVFISQAFHVGTGDYRSVDYYYDLDTSKSTNGWITWFMTNERAVSNPDKFMYFRYEGYLGFTFNLGKYLGFTIETGYTTLMGNKGEAEDRVYVKTPGEAYKLIYSEKYYSIYDARSSYYNLNSNQNYRPGYVLSRFSVVFRFGHKPVK